MTSNRLEFARWLVEHGKLADWSEGDDPATFEPLGIPQPPIPENVTVDEVLDWGRGLAVAVSRIRSEVRRSCFIPPSCKFTISRVDWPDGTVQAGLLVSPALGDNGGLLCAGESRSELGALCELSSYLGRHFDEIKRYAFDRFNRSAVR